MERTPIPTTPNPIKRVRAVSVDELKQGTDSKPYMFQGFDMTEMHKAQSKWLSHYNPLDEIDVESTRECLNEFTQGAMAKQQWYWELIELYSGLVSICVDKRDKALKKYNPIITIRPGLEDRDQIIAESQQRTATDLINSIKNMPDAITALGMASRRHYKLLQPYYSGNDLFLQPVDNWLICRDGHRGAWRYNPRATFGNSRGEDFPVPLSQMIFRVCPRPIDMPIQILVVNSQTTLAQWDVFLSRYGTPPTFIVMPPNVDEGMVEAYNLAAERCVSNAAGTLPHGSDLKSPTVPATSVELFDRRYKISREEIVIIMQGSSLMTLTAPGSGTLAGGPQQDSWDDLMLGEAEEIGGVLTEQLVYSCLDQYHPGQRKLIDLTLSKAEKSDPATEVNIVSQLRAAGYDLDDDQVSERTGWNVVQGVAPLPLYAPVGGDQRVIHTRTPYRINRQQQDLKNLLALHRMGTKYEPAREALEYAVHWRLDNLERQLLRLTKGGEPLTAAERKQIRDGLKAPTAQDLLELSKSLEKDLAGTIEQDEESDAENELPPVAKPLHVPNSTN